VDEAEKLELLAGQHGSPFPIMAIDAVALDAMAVVVCLANAHKQIMNGPYLFGMCSATF